MHVCYFGNGLYYNYLNTGNVFQVKVEDDRYWGIVFHHDRNWNQLW